MIEILERPAIREQAAPLSLEGYHVLRDLGLVPVKSELLNGVVVEKVTKSPLHTLIAHRLQALLAAGLPAGYQLRKEDPLTLDDSEPEPNLAVVAGDIETFRDHHPDSAALVVEIAATSADIDRAKADLYAAAGIPAYWLVLGREETVEVHASPANGRYRDVQQVTRSEKLRTWYGAEIPLARLFD